MPAIAQDGTGEAEAGQAFFQQKMCTTCHIVTTNDGTRMGSPSPINIDLSGVVGSEAASAEGPSSSRYSAAMKTAKEKGLVWTEENLIAFITSPQVFLSEYNGSSAVSSMPLGTNDAEASEDIVAFLASLSE